MANELAESVKNEQSFRQLFIHSIPIRSHLKTHDILLVLNLQ